MAGDGLWRELGLLAADADERFARDGLLPVPEVLTGREPGRQLGAQGGGVAPGPVELGAGDAEDVQPPLVTACQAAAATPGQCSARKSSSTTTPYGFSAARAVAMSAWTCSYRCEASTCTKRQLPSATWPGTIDDRPCRTVGNSSWKDR